MKRALALPCLFAVAFILYNCHGGLGDSSLVSFCDPSDPSCTDPAPVPEDTPTPTPTSTCGLPSGMKNVSLVYPTFFAPTDPGELIVASDNGGFPLTADGDAWNVEVVPHGAGPNGEIITWGDTFGAPILPPFSAPARLPTFANPVYQPTAIPNGIFQSGSITYDVYADDESSDCTPSQLIGTFSTL